jgi:hypothetical protein
MCKCKVSTTLEGRVKSSDEQNEQTQYTQMQSDTGVWIGNSNITMGRSCLYVNVQ